MSAIRMSANDLARIEAESPGGSIGAQIATHLLLQARTEVTERERRSWDLSLPVLAKALVDAGLGAVEVLIEHSLPRSSKRVGVILAGVGHDEADRFMVVGLEQWREAELFEKNSELVLPRDSDGAPVLHPSRLVEGYRDYLADLMEDLTPGSIEGIAYLHEASAADVNELLELPEAERPRLFTRSNSEALSNYLRSVFSPRPGAEAAERFESARIGPPKRLLDYAAAEIQQRDQFVLLNEQRVAFELVLHLVRKALGSFDKEVVIVSGGPGSGKSVIALALLARLDADQYRVAHATGSRSFTETMRRHVAKGSSELKKKFVYFNGFMAADADGLDVLLCDEAHRIRKTSANRFTKQEFRTERPQVDELMAAARVPVFFLDEHQVVRPGERGSVAEIEKYAKDMGCKVHRIDLSDQYRNGGSARYEQWVPRLLNLEPGEPIAWEGDDRFELVTDDSPWDLEARLGERISEGYSARMAAGYCWKWSDTVKDQHLVPDVVIGDWSRPWNVKGERGVDGAPPSSLWASQAGGFGQVGCVYTAQGFEYDYSGVIIGPDLVYRDGRFVTQRSENKDPALKKSTPDEVADRLIRNTYKVLLTRGLRGTSIYSTDPETREFLSSLIRRGTQSAVSGSTEQHENAGDSRPAKRGQPSVRVVIDNHLVPAGAILRFRHYKSTEAAGLANRWVEANPLRAQAVFTGLYPKCLRWIDGQDYSVRALTMLIMAEAGIKPDKHANGPRYWIDSNGRSLADTAAEFERRTRASSDTASIGPESGPEPKRAIPLPRSRALAYPVLEALRSLGGRAAFKEIDAKVIASEGFTEEQLQVRLPDGRGRIIFHLAWARTQLKDAGLLANPARSIWEVTDSGSIVDRDRTLQLLDMHGDPLEKAGAELARDGHGDDLAPMVADDVTEFKARLENYRRSLEPELLQAVLNAPPEQLGQIIVELLDKIGYTGRGGWVKVLDGPGDGGVDGVAVEDRLGLDKVYCQAKRYALDRPVGTSDIREFVGALTFKFRDKGVFVTTSTFTEDARELAKRSPVHLRLIDGRELAAFMLEYGIGTETHTFKVPKIDPGFFGGPIG